MQIKLKGQNRNQNVCNRFFSRDLTLFVGIFFSESHFSRIEQKTSAVRKHPLEG